MGQHRALTEVQTPQLIVKKFFKVSSSQENLIQMTLNCH